MLLDTEPDGMSMNVLLGTKYFLPSVIIFDKSVSRKERKINRHLKDRRSRKSLSGSASDTWHTYGGKILDFMFVYLMYWQTTCCTMSSRMMLMLLTVRMNMKMEKKRTFLNTTAILVSISPKEVLQRMGIL